MSYSSCGPRTVPVCGNSESQSLSQMQGAFASLTTCIRFDIPNYTHGPHTVHGKPDDHLITLQGSGTEQQANLHQENIEVAGADSSPQSGNRCVFCVYCVIMYMCIYIYTKSERERERERESTLACQLIST